MAPVIKALNNCPEIESRVCVTGQHRQMLDQVLDLFDIQPDIDLNLMRPNQTLAMLTADILTNLNPVLQSEHPDWVLVQGDTTTVMAASLLCYYSHIQVGHVEAGLRTHDKWQPFPEEINRRVASVIADLHFAPTEHSRQNLLNEGVADNTILVTGNPVIDALNEIVRLPTTVEIQELLEHLEISSGKKKLVLITAHRRENFGEPLKNICLALRNLAQAYPDQLQLVYPVHLNPNVTETVYPMLGHIPNISLLKPLEYLNLVQLMKQATLVLTDSGGLQEEATSLGKPTLVLRNVTERPEGVDAGVLKLVGTDPELILQSTRRLLDDPAEYEKMANAKNPFGDGHASGRIVQAILQFSPK